MVLRFSGKGSIRLKDRTQSVQTSNQTCVTNTPVNMDTQGESTHATLQVRTSFKAASPSPINNDQASMLKHYTKSTAMRNNGLGLATEHSLYSEVGPMKNHSNVRIKESGIARFDDIGTIWSKNERQKRQNKKLKMRGVR